MTQCTTTPQFNCIDKSVQDLLYNIPAKRDLPTSTKRTHSNEKYIQIQWTIHSDRCCNNELNFSFAQNTLPVYRGFFCASFSSTIHFIYTLHNIIVFGSAGVCVCLQWGNTERNINFTFFTCSNSLCVKRRWFFFL